MRAFGLLASVILLAGLAACAEAAGPNYAYAPSELYGPWPEGYYYAPGEIYGPWPEGYCCCGPRLVPVKHFHHHGNGHGHVHGHGGHHH